MKRVGIFLSILLTIFSFNNYDVHPRNVIVILLIFLTAVFSLKIQIKDKIQLVTILLFASITTIFSLLNTLKAPLLGDVCEGYVTSSSPKSYTVYVYHCNTQGYISYNLIGNTYGRSIVPVYTNVLVRITSTEIWSVYNGRVEIVSDYNVEAVYRPYFDSLKYSLLLLGNKQKQRFYKIIKKISSDDISALGVSILFGGTDFSDETRDIVGGLGLLHIVAISGVNILYLQSFLRGIIKSTRIVTRRLIEVLSVNILWVIVGSQFSLVRAIYSSLLNVLLGQIGFRRNKFDFLLIFSFLLVLEPLLVNSVSFWLVFGACIGIYIVIPEFTESRFYKNRGSLGKELINGVLVWMCVSPFILYYFHSFSIVSIFTTLIVSPVIEVITIAGYLVFFLSYIPFLGDLSVYVYSLIVNVFYGILLVLDFAKSSIP